MNKFVSTLSLLAVISVPAMADDHMQTDPNNQAEQPVIQEQTMPSEVPNQDLTNPDGAQGKYNAAEEEEALKTEEELIQEEIKRQEEMKIIR